MSDERAILIVEPDETLRDKIKEAFSSFPCRFIELESSGDAITTLAVDAPNGAVLSSELPDGDGIELLRGIRAFDREIPIIVMVGKPTKEKILAAKQARAVDILLKPPDIERLATKLVGAMWENPATVKKGGAVSFEEELKKHQVLVEQEKEEPFVEAIPKGAEILNINDTIGGMKLAKTLLFEDVVYGDKGQLLTEDRIRHLNKMGVAEVCVYIDPILKKKVEERKKAQAKASSIKTTDSGAVVGATQQSGPQKEKSFAKVNRSSVRVEVGEPATISFKNPASGETVTEDAKIADVSAGGCALLSKDKFDKGQELTISFTLDGGKFQMKDVKGIVRHSMRRFGTDDFPQRNGIFFTSLTERFRENLITILFKLERDLRQKEKDQKKPRSFKLVD